MAGAGNTITTTTGMGLSLNDTIVGATGVTFQSVTVNGATERGVPQQRDRRGGDGQRRHGRPTPPATAVSINNAANVTLNGMVINTTAGDGVQFTQNTGTSRLSINNLQISGTTGEGISMDVERRRDAGQPGGRQQSGDQHQRRERDRAQHEPALKVVNLLVEDSAFNGNSAG